MVGNIALVRHYARADDIPLAYRPPHPFLEFSDEDYPDDEPNRSRLFHGAFIKVTDGARRFLTGEDRRARTYGVSTGSQPEPAADRRAASSTAMAAMPSAKVGSGGSSLTGSPRIRRPEGPGQRRVRAAVDPGGMEQVVGGDEKIGRRGDGILAGHVLGHGDGPFP